MKKEYLSVALAYVGVIVGAGLSSGQDLLQYFLCFGNIGLVGILVLAGLNILFGKIIITLGSYFQSSSHDDVLSQIAHPIIHRIIDLTLVISSFVLGFVMVAGAGSNLEQQFGVPSWLGSLICSALIIIVSFMDFDKIARVLGIFTPIIIFLILVITAYTFIGKSYDFNYLDSVAKTLKPSIPNVWLSVINYYALCAMTGVSMAFVLGGSVVRIGVAENGGLVGGTLIGAIVTATSLSLYANLDKVKDADIPMLEIVNRIHPYFAVFYAIVIFALIFNTAFSLYYATARRFAGGDSKKMKIILIAFVLVGYICSFGGFKKLVSIMYPILGYMGIVLLITLLIAWIKEKENISSEALLRKSMLRLWFKKLDDSKKFTKKDKKHLQTLGEASIADGKDLSKDIQSYAEEIIEREDDISSYVESELDFNKEEKQQLKEYVEEQTSDNK